MTSYSSRLTLDEEQQEVVDYMGSQVVIAGPGSGKTRVLVAKAEKLFSEGRDIICLTFTRAAAREMRERMPGIPAQTIHSFCYGEVGWTGDYETMLSKTILRQRELEKKAKSIGRPVWTKYEWVLVDEVQDLTEYQWEVVESYVGKHLFAVGDPYQSIYGWNEALGQEIIEYLRLFGCKEFHLKGNYRSCPEIVSLLNRVYRRDLVSRNVKDTGKSAILTRRRLQVKEIAEILKRNGVGFTVRYGSTEASSAKEETFGSEELRVMTCHCSKGLEFDKVILYSWYPEPFWGEELNLYYVSMARASKEFKQVWGESRLLGVLDG